MRSLVLAIMFALCCSCPSAAGSPIEDVTNRLSSILVASNYTFTINFGPQGTLSMQGYQQGTDCAFRVMREGVELFRHAESRIRFPSAGTGGSVSVRIPFSFHIVTGFGGQRSATLGVSLMPPTRRPPLLLANYSGMAMRIAELPDHAVTGAGWSYCDTNQTGTCIEIGPRQGEGKAFISLQRTEPDLGSVFLHELSVAAGSPAERMVAGRATRDVEATDFGVCLTFLREISTATLRSVLEPTATNETLAAYGRAVDKCALGLDGALPQLPRGLRPPPLPGAPGK